MGGKREKGEEEEEEAGAPPAKRVRPEGEGEVARERREAEEREGRLTFKRKEWFAARAEARKGRAWKNAKAILAAERYEELPPAQPTFVSVAAGPSALPHKKYCDITGLEAKYVEPRTRLRYAYKDLCPLIRSLHPQEVQEILAARGAKPARLGLGLH